MTITCTAIENCVINKMREKVPYTSQIMWYCTNKIPWASDIEMY